MSGLKTYDYTQEQRAAFAYAIITTEKGKIVLKLNAEETPTPSPILRRSPTINFTTDLRFIASLKTLWHKAVALTVAVRAVLVGLLPASVKDKKVNTSEVSSRWHMQVQTPAVVSFLSASSTAHILMACTRSSAGSKKTTKRVLKRSTVSHKTIKSSQSKSKRSSNSFDM